MLVESIAEQLYFTTVRLVTRSCAQHSAATGFVYNVPTDKGAVHILVSNKHVLADDLDELTVAMIAGNNGQPAYGTGVVVDVSQLLPSVLNHPRGDVDVAALPFGPVLSHMATAAGGPFFRAIPPELSLNEENITSLDAVEDVAFVGYPASLYDTKNLTPIMRRGTTATPVALDYRGWPAFLIDAAVFPGSSGSPVFLLNRGSWATRDGGLVAGTRIVFLGVLAAVHTRSVEAELTPLPTRMGIAFADPLNLGIVFKARVVDELADLLLEKYGFKRAQTPVSPAEGETVADQEIAEAEAGDQVGVPDESES